MGNRRAGLPEYEPPIVESFRTATALDARELDPRAACWLTYRASDASGVAGWLGHDTGAPRLIGSQTPKR